MIEITFDPKKYQISFSGHAGYCEEEGKDIVCSAVSTLYYTLVGCLAEREEFLRKGSLKYKEKSGNSSVRCTPLLKYEGNIQVIYLTILTGIQMIAESYPENVKLIVKG